MSTLNISSFYKENQSSDVTMSEAPHPKEDVKTKKVSSSVLGPSKTISKKPILSSRVGRESLHAAVPLPRQLQAEEGNDDDDTRELQGHITTPFV